jgi:hypothetical protein
MTGTREIDYAAIMLLPLAPEQSCGNEIEGAL